MYKLLLSAILSMAFSVSSYSQESRAIDITFVQENLDIGTVKRGEKRTFQYQFTNTGTESIEIAIVSGCDCTTLEWTRGVIAPQDSGVIDVIFDSSEKEASETVDVDMYLKNINKKSDSQYLFILDYTFELEE